MKKIKAKIINEYNRYLISTKNSIRKQLRSLQFSLLKEFSRFSSLTRKTFFYFVRLKFMKNSKVTISVFNRYLILLIVILFSSLFYLSTPSLYNYVTLQKELTEKLLKEFNLNTALSANINYKILPSPNFEISNVLLITNKNNKFDEYAQIKKMKIYISTKNLQNQKQIEIKNIVISEANFNIDENSYDYINNYLKNKISNKKIQIKKSKIFFRENNDEKEVIALSTLNKSKIFYDEKNYNNKITIDGSVYNTRYKLNLSRNIYKKNITNISINLKKLKTKIENKFIEDLDKKNTYNGETYINFLGSEINTKYQVVDQNFTIYSKNSKINNKNISFKGNIIFSPFDSNIDASVESINVIKTIANLSKLKNLLDEKILLNKNINVNILLSIDSLKGIKIFDSAVINLRIINGKLMLNNSVFISDKIGKMFFLDSVLESVDKKQIFKSKILFEIYNQKKFFQKLQIPKTSRINLNNIYFEIEKDLHLDEIIINKLLLNKKTVSNSLNKTINFTDLVDLNEINEIKNWIELKKFSAQIFSEISKIN